MNEIEQALSDAADAVDRAARMIEADYLEPGHTSQHIRVLFAQCAVIQGHLMEMADIAKALFTHTEEPK